jgi:hypothetical protein
MAKFRGSQETTVSGVQSFRDRGGSWEEYKKYLQSRVALAVFDSLPNLPADKKSGKPVPWVGKDWSEMGATMQGMVIDHIGVLYAKFGRDQAIAYCKFMHDKAGAPSDLINRIGG